MRILLFLFNCSIVLAQTTTATTQPVSSGDNYLWVGWAISIVGFIVSIGLALLNNFTGKKSYDSQMRIHEILTKFKDDMKDDYEDTQKEHRRDLKDLVDRFEIYKTNITDKWDSLKDEIVKDQRTIIQKFETIVKDIDDLPERFEIKLTTAFTKYESDMRTAHMKVSTKHVEFMSTLDKTLDNFTKELKDEIAIRMNVINEQNEQVIGDINNLIESIAILKDYSKLILNGGKEDLSTFFINEGNGEYVRKLKLKEK